MINQLKAFISRSFAPGDDTLVHALLGVVRACDIEAIDLKESPESGQDSIIVRDAIKTADFVIGILTLRDGAIPGWIHHEMTLAEEFKKPLVLLRERNVNPALLGARHNHGALIFDRERLHPEIGEVVKFLKKAVRRVQGQDHQFDEEGIRVEVQRKGRKIPTEITVHQLAAGRPLQLTWSTVLRGMEFLHQQIQNRGIPVNLVVGVNPTGTILAAYLKGRLRDRGEPLGTINTSASAGEDRMYRACLPPFEESVRHVLVVDSEFKSGRSAIRVVEELRKHFRNDQLVVHYAVLVACGITLDSAEGKKRAVPIRELFKRGVNHFVEAKTTLIPDFLAFITPDTIQAPDHLA